jgi:tetratricopeptide (TPR) repeat protein
MNSRLDILKGILDQKPDDAFARYGLAMEYLKLGRAEEAVAEFQALIAAHPDYSYAYYHGGQAYEKLGRLGDAREIYRLGLERAPDAHARSEIQGALDLIT